jgi:hypothetical protein
MSENASFTENHKLKPVQFLLDFIDRLIGNSSSADYSYKDN